MTPIPTTSLPSGISIPVLGQGTWKMGEDRRKFDDEVRAVKLGLDLGVTLIDTAEMYGSGGAEKVVREAVTGRRDAAYIVSKVLPSNASRAGVIRACEASLKRLGAERIDLYLLHWRGQYALAETVEAFEMLKRQGKIVHWGVSNFDADDMAELATTSDGDAVQANQVLYNLSSRGVEFDLLPQAQARGLPIMAYSPVGQGRLSGHPLLAEIGARHGVTAAQIALAWTMSRPGVIAIPKATSPEHVRQNRAAIAIRLTDEDCAALDRAFPPPSRRQALEMI